MSNYQKVLEALGGRQLTEEQAAMLAAIPKNDVAGLNRFLRQFTAFSTADKLRSYWIANVLSGPRTHVRNIVSNFIFGQLQMPIRAVEALVDIPMARLQKRPREVFLREIPAAYRGYLAGLIPGLRKAASIARRGIDMMQA